MDILETKKKGELNNEVSKIMLQLKMFNNPIELKGSASLKSQHYFSDYDFFSPMLYKPNPHDVFLEFKNKFSRILSNEDNNFIEFKIQTLKSKKYKYFNVDEIDFETFKKEFDNIDFCKIDLICRFQGKFYEVSCIYQFNIINEDSPANEAQFKKSLEEDVTDLIKDKNYYKALKRKFVIYKIEGNTQEIIKLSNVFNSDIGAKYQLMSNLEAIKKLLEHTNDPTTIKKIIVNLNNIKVETNVDGIDNLISKLRKQINRQAKKLI